MEKSDSPVFLGADPATANDPTAPYAVLPVPYERSVSYGTGTAKGPAAILDASGQVEAFDEEFFEPLALRVQTLPRVEFAGLSDWECMDRIRLAAHRVLRQGRFLLSLGGEHTVTMPLVAAAQAVHGRLSVLHIDAHTDLRSEYTHTPLSHACAMRRVREMDLPTVSVGIRELSAEEYDYIRQNNVPIFWARDLAQAKDMGWVEAVLKELRDPVYVTVDVDGLDPSIVPGTGTPEPGGLSWQQVTGLLRAVCAARKVVAADVVELAPIPASAVSDFAVARLAAKLLLYHKRGRR